MAAVIKQSIIFFGSGPLALESLKFLETSFSVEAVITKPRPAHHRGAVPVLEYCDERGLTVYSPATKRELSALFAQQRFASTYGVVIDYGIIIDQDVIDSFSLGIINSHFSLLPEWRGADPITFALLSGQPETGVSLMRINDKMDEGPLLAQAVVPIGPADDARSLTTALLEVSNQLLAEILPLYEAGQIQVAPQSNTIAQTTKPSYSRKLTKQDGILDWYKPAEQLEREVRAYIEWPKSRTTLGTVDIVVTKAHVVPQMASEPGTIQINAKSLAVSTVAGGLAIDRLKPAGKAEMSSAAFLAGYAARLGL